MYRSEGGKSSVRGRIFKAWNVYTSLQVLLLKQTIVLEIVANFLCNTGKNLPKTICHAFNPHSGTTITVISVFFAVQK